MPKLRVHCFSMSLDGYSAGPEQSLDAPLGVGGEALAGWLIATRSWRRSHDLGGGATGIDDDWSLRAEAGIGATIMGRNMFGPVRGPWSDDDWKGWWGESPPFHHPVFVLTHHARDPIPMEDGTTFHFVTDGIERALERAFAAAGGKDVRLGGGVSTIQQYLRAGLVDEMHVVTSPVVLGGGERLFDRLGPDYGERYAVAEHATSESVLHTRIVRR